MCSYLDEFLEFFARQIADWLSSLITTGALTPKSKSVNNLFNHIAFWVAPASATYCASAVDKAIQDCLLVRQDTKPPAKTQQ